MYHLLFGLLTCTASYVSQWIVDKNIFGTLFNVKHTRENIIKKGLAVVVFLAEEGKLSVKDIELIWACTEDKYLYVFFFYLCSTMVAVNAVFNLVPLGPRHHMRCWQESQKLTRSF